MDNCYSSFNCDKGIEESNIEDEIKIINYIIKTNKTKKKENSLPNNKNTLDISDNINNKYLKLKEKINKIYKESKDYGNIKKNLKKIDEFIKKIEAKLNKLEMEMELESYY